LSLALCDKNKDNFGERTIPVKVIDNLLDKQVFLKLKEFVMSSELPWHFASDSVYKNDGDVQFFHPLYIAPTKSEYFDKVCMPIMQELDGFVTLLRAKMNMSLKKDEVTKKGMHIDFDDMKQYYKVMKTSIFYFNTTDGPTYFENGKKVDCVENRLITFPMGTMHCGTYASNAERRIVLNLNWF
jgi:hypothetical protein